MQYPRNGLAAGWIGILLLASGGCTVSVQPWTKPVAGPGGMDGGVPNMMPVGAQSPMSRQLPGMPPGMPPSATNETMMQLIKQYNEADEHRKALVEQVQAFKSQVKAREDNLRLASHEMEESSSKLKRTREEFRQWETEMQELRDRVRKLEENRRSVGQLIEEILHHLERPREPLKLPSIDRAIK